MSKCQQFNTNIHILQYIYSQIKNYKENSNEDKNTFYT